MRPLSIKCAYPRSATPRVTRDWLRFLRLCGCGVLENQRCFRLLLRDAEAVLAGIQARKAHLPIQGEFSGIYGSPSFPKRHARLRQGSPLLLDREATRQRRIVIVSERDPDLEFTYDLADFYTLPLGRALRSGSECRGRELERGDLQVHRGREPGRLEDFEPRSHHLNHYPRHRPGPLGWISLDDRLSDSLRQGLWRRKPLFLRQKAADTAQCHDLRQTSITLPKMLFQDLLFLRAQHAADVVAQLSVPCTGIFSYREE